MSVDDIISKCQKIGHMSNLEFVCSQNSNELCCELSSFRKLLRWSLVLSSQRMRQNPMLMTAEILAGCKTSPWET